MVKFKELLSANISQIQAFWNIEKMLKIVLIMALTFTISIVDAGSLCPKREFLYPCYCANIPIVKRKMYTLIVCPNVPESDAIGRIQMFQMMDIDRFVLLDSFWNIEKHAEESDVQRQLPENWLTKWQVKGLEIVDSDMSEKFACNFQGACSKNDLKSLTIRNSSSSDTIPPYCQHDKNAIVFWTSCLNKLETFEFIFNKLKKFDHSLFFNDMLYLKTLNLSHNEISTIGQNSFSKLVKLQSLDLSYNKIANLPDGVFGDAAIDIKFLDISSNLIKTLSPTMFKVMPNLTFFGAQSNLLQKLPEAEWKYLGNKIRSIQLNDNPIGCNCDIIWINCTLKVHVSITGFCANDDYDMKPLRRAAIYMSERCTKDGIIKEINNSTQKGNACRNFVSLKDKESMANNNLRQFSPEVLPIINDQPRRNKNKRQ